MAIKQQCPLCKKQVSLTNDERFRSHKDEKNRVCSGSTLTFSHANKIYNDRLQRRDIWEGFC